MIINKKIDMLRNVLESIVVSTLVITGTSYIVQNTNCDQFKQHLELYPNLQFYPKVLECCQEINMAIQACGYTFNTLTYDYFNLLIALEQETNVQLSSNYTAHLYKCRITDYMNKLSTLKLTNYHMHDTVTENVAILLKITDDICHNIGLNIPL